MWGGSWNKLFLRDDLKKEVWLLYRQAWRDFSSMGKSASKGMQLRVGEGAERGEEQHLCVHMYIGVMPLEN